MHHDISSSSTYLCLKLFTTCFDVTRILNSYCREITRLHITMQPLIQDIFTQTIDFYFYLSKGFSDFSETTFESIICQNDELSSTMRWVSCLLKDSQLFILCAENRQILLKICVIPIPLTFMYMGALNLLVNNQLNLSSNSTLHCGI